MNDVMNKTVLLKQAHKAIRSKIHLTAMENSHIKHLIKLAQEPTLSDLMGWNTFFEEDDIEGFIESVSNFALPYSRKSPPIVFGIYLESEGELPIGYVALKGLNRDLFTAETAVAILDNKFSGKGYGRLALKRMITYAFHELLLKTIAVTILVSNKISINGAKKLGFVVKEIMYKSWAMPNGELADMLWMEVTSDTWRF